MTRAKKSEAPPEKRTVRLLVMVTPSEARAARQAAVDESTGDRLVTLSDLIRGLIRKRLGLDR